jgi:hypothetical protein
MAEMAPDKRVRPLRWVVGGWLLVSIGGCTSPQRPAVATPSSQPAAVAVVKPTSDPSHQTRVAPDPTARPPSDALRTQVAVRQTQSASRATPTVDVIALRNRPEFSISEPRRDLKDDESAQGSVCPGDGRGTIWGTLGDEDVHELLALADKDGGYPVLRIVGADGYAEVITYNCQTSEPPANLGAEGVDLYYQKVHGIWQLVAKWLWQS